MRQPLSILATTVLLGILSCARTEPPVTPTGSTLPVKDLTLISVGTMSVGEPSGLAYAPKTGTLYMVSDSRQEIFIIDTTGRVLSSIPVTASDLEGIALSPNADTIYVVEETASQITRFLPNGTKISSQPVLIRTDPKHALEGITVNPDGHIIVLNEKTPTALAEYSGTSEVRRLTLSETSDISDICYDAVTDAWWVVSDESRRVLKYSRSGQLLGVWASPLEQGEGIAFIGDRLYLVSDSDAKFYVFARP
ncbi:MAG: SdiA-regulated domain-containing protein [Ignavibacteriae bacterium]|nr:SdiA-regulated domain-containing protein [Ignavibacteriota bacterium]